MSVCPPEASLFHTLIKQRQKVLALVRSLRAKMVRMIKQSQSRFVETAETRIEKRAAKNAPEVNALYVDPAEAKQEENTNEDLDRHQPVRGRHRMDLIYNKYGCGDPRMRWGFDDKFPDCLSGRMKNEQWKYCHEELNDGYLQGIAIRYIWTPILILGLVGAICEGALRAGRYVPTGLIP